MTILHRRLRRGVLASAAALSVVAGGAGMAVSSPDSTSPATAASLDSPATAAAPEAISEALRIGGANRYGTAAEIARNFPRGTTDMVILASGEVFPDALSAQLPTGAFGMTQGDGAEGTGLDARRADDAGSASPILLTRPGSLPSETRSALLDLQPSQVVIIGGEAAVSKKVAAQVAAMGPDVDRIGGENRYETSALVAKQHGQDVDVVYVATGEEFPDALSGAARAARDGAPLLLTDDDQLRPVTADALTYLSPDRVVILGGTAAVTQDVEDGIAAIVPDTTRLAGADRYGTSAVISATYEKDNNVFLASGQNYPDALSGGALAGFYGGPLLLTRQGTIPSIVQQAIDWVSPQDLIIFGGQAAVGGAVETWVNARLSDWVDSLHVQLLSFNDFHGHLQTEDATLTEEQDPDQHVVGGAVNLATTLNMLRTRSFDDQSLTVAAGDLIGGSTFLSGMFHDEPSIEAMNAMGLDVSSVGNHEFDEGTTELLRMQYGGCHPIDGCYFPEQPYAGADFPYLAANVIRKSDGQPMLPATNVRTIDGVKVGFIGMTLQATPTLVSPGGVSSVDFKDEVETANAQAAALQEQGVESIVVLLHEGGYVTGNYNGCEGITEPIVTIAENIDPSVDALITGHTHQPYVCMIDDPAGNPRSVTSANQYGRVVTETDLAISRTTHDVIRDEVVANNNLVLESVPDDAAVTAVLDKWVPLSEETAGNVVGTITEDITGAAGGCRCEETQMGNLMADAILWGTDDPDEGGAQISFMNVGGIRAELLFDQISNDEDPGEVTYQEAYNVAPFGNLLVSMDLTGAQIDTVLEQQYQPVDDRGARPMLALGNSAGFSYDWDYSQPQGSRASNLELDDAQIDPAATYRVSTLNFLAEGGDLFTEFTEGTNIQGGPEDLKNLVDFMGANSPLSAPATDRVNELNKP